MPPVHRRSGPGLRGSRNGEVYLCSYCEEKLATLPLVEIAARIHGVMAKQFELTPNHPVDVEEFVAIAMDLDWERKGETAEAVISEIAMLEPHIARDVARLLSDSFGWREARDGGEDPYGSDAHHLEVEPDTIRFKNSWANFRREIETEVRFFGTNAETTLYEIFADLRKQATSTNAITSTMVDMPSSGDWWRKLPLP